MRHGGYDWVDWVLGIVATILVAWMLAISSRVDAHETRITRAEASYEEGTKPSLDRIEKKLDRILEHYEPHP